MSLCVIFQDGLYYKTMPYVMIVYFFFYNLYAIYFIILPNYPN